MEPMAVVLDVSSDEEEEVACLEDKKGRNMTIDFDWVKEFLDISDEESNEVAVMHEVNKPQRKSKKSSISTPSVDDDDDDCVVLDTDPESRVTTVDDSSTGSDEVVVVGEKGQIACRDYPHPRHLCVMFPFSSTPHEKHCDQCHCYVCDYVAPCPKWGTGFLGTDHCHATEKSETWRSLRKNFKLGKTAPLPASTNHCTLSDVTNSQQNHILPFRVMSPNSMLLNQTSISTATHTCSPVNFIPQNQASRPITTIMNTCSSLNSSFQNHTVPSIATNFTIPSCINHGRYGELVSTLVRNRYQSHSIPPHSLGVHNRAIQRVRQHGVGTLVPQFHSHTFLNGLGSVGVGSTLPMNHSTHGASGGFINNDNPAQQYPNYHAATGFSNNSRTSYGQNAYAYVPQNFGYPNPFSQLNNLSSVSNYSTAHETQASYQSNGSQNFYAYSVQGDNAPSSNNVAGLSRVENACGNVTQSGTTRQYSCQQKPHDASLIEAALKADRIGDANQSNPHQQSSESMNISSSANESGTQFTGSTRLSDENSVPVGADGALASELNASPDLSTFDGAFYFDFETTWDCLARV
ncbi:hypothetical protein HKD37_19G054389 [Glycine soja]|nr:hypothetical protein JHK87_053787 [Glycine soja]